MIDTLLAAALREWPMFDGWCAGRAVDPFTLSVTRLANLIYFWMTRNLDAEQRTKFDVDLNRPPPGVSPEEKQESGPWSREAEMAAFMSLAGS